MWSDVLEEIQGVNVKLGNFIFGDMYGVLIVTGEYV